MKTMSIYEAITAGTTVKNSAKARISAEKVGIDIFAPWRVAENTAFEAFYRYADARRQSANMGEEASIDATITSNAFTALRTLLALIGNVNGHKVYANAAMLDTLAGCTMRIVKPLAGEALTQASIVKNLRDEVNGIRAGMEADYVNRITNEYEEAKIRLAELKKRENSCTTEHTRVSANAFYLALENELATIVNEQNAKSWEALEAEESAREAERKAKRKANKQAKKSAK